MGSPKAETDAVAASYVFFSSTCRSWRDAVAIVMVNRRNHQRDLLTRFRGSLSKQSNLLRDLRTPEGRPCTTSSVSFRLTTTRWYRIFSWPFFKLPQSSHNPCCAFTPISLPHSYLSSVVGWYKNVFLMPMSHTLLVLFLPFLPFNGVPVTSYNS